MLTPEYLEDLPEEILKLFYEVEQEILVDMARRVSTYDYWIPAAEYQRQKLREAGALQEDILKALSGLTGKSETELKRMMQEAGTKALQSDTAVYEAAGMTVPKIPDSEPLRAILNAGYKATAQTMRNICKTTAQTATMQFENALDLAWLKVQSGAFDTDSAVRAAIKELAERGIQSIRYPSGRTDSIEVAVRRAVVTGVNQTAGQLQEELADELGCDLVEVSAHAGARPEHASWQGRIYSRSGNDPKYPPFRQSTGYGTGAGLCGWNCRHTFGPYIEGSPPVWSEEQLAELDAPKYEYNGKKLTEYEASQQQRYNERQIRRWKREEAAMKAAGLDSSDAASKVKEWQGRQQEFIAQTGFKRQYGREQISVANQRNRGIINSKGKISARITEESFLRLIDCIPTNRTADERNRFQDAAVALLTEAYKIDGGASEVGAIYSPGFKKKLWSGRGEKGSVGIPLLDVPHMVLHTHPDCRTFSETDINHFVMNEYVEEIIAIGNDGGIFSLRRTDRFIASDFVLAFAGLFFPGSYVYESRDIYAKAMSDFLKEAAQYGVEYFERSAKSS